MYEFLATFPNGVVDVLSTVAVQLREDWYGYIHFHKLETNIREITYIKSQPSFIIHYFPPSTFFLNISKIRQAKQFTPIDLNFDLWNPVSKFRSSAFRLLIFQISTKLPSLVNLSKFLIFVNHLQKKKKGYSISWNSETTISCSQGRPVALILSHKETSSVHASYTRDLVSLKLFLQRVYSSRVAHYYTGQCTRYERDRRGERKRVRAREMNSSGEYSRATPSRQVLINKHTVTADTVRLECGDKGNRVGRVSFEMSENARGSRAYKLYKIKGCPPWIASSFWRMRGDCIGCEFASEFRIGFA